MSFQRLITPCDGLPRITAHLLEGLLRFFCFPFLQHSTQLCIVKSSCFVSYAIQGYTQSFFSWLIFSSCKSFLLVFFLTLHSACWILLISLLLVSFQICLPVEMSVFFTTSFVATQLTNKAADDAAITIFFLPCHLSLEHLFHTMH